MTRCAIYARCSTDEQTTANQLDVLREVARLKGLTIVKEFIDDGVSGARGRDKRKGFDELLKGATRKDFDMIIVWSVDRLGRNISDLISFLNEIQSVECDLYLHQNGIDTSTPTGRLMFGMLSLFADFERSMISERTKAGLERARRQGRRIGRPSNMNDGLAESVKFMRSQGLGIRRIARDLGIGVSSVYKVLDAA
ncbi:recombinase family protein [Alphaproteobacteria bacterium]|jgi:DNA invertase Pin-like site-specific DNA recombinase|nr:recombinase family protein [Alphaproteobacteria bacterium]